MVYATKLHMDTDYVTVPQSCASMQRCWWLCPLPSLCSGRAPTAPWHMEVPRLGVKLEQQRGIWNTSAIYSAACGKDGPLTPWARPGIEPTASWILVGFLIHWATMGTLFFFFLSFFSFLFLLHLWHMEVPVPGTEPMPLQWPKLLQWQHWILNPLCHRRTPELSLPIHIGQQELSCVSK